MVGTAKELKPIGIERLLEWAFGDQGAELDPRMERSEFARRANSMEFVLMERAKLGCQIDGRGSGFFGGRDVHWDADQVAAVCKRVLPWKPSSEGIASSQTVASYASAGTRPTWMPGAIPKVRPADWSSNQHGRQPATDKAKPGAKYPGGTWRDWMTKPTLHRCRQKGIWPLSDHEKEHLSFIGRVTPIVFEPSRQQINACRIEYMAWWSALHTVREHLIARDVLTSHRLTREMPPSMPWVEAGEGAAWLPEHRKGGRTPWS